MSEVKWIKLCADIFNDEKILVIESLPDADSIIVIWFKLLCLAGKQNNGGVFMMTDKIAYTDEMLASIFRRNINKVRLALETFKNFGMIEIIDNVITIPNWGKHQTLDALEKKREYDRNYQAKKRIEQKKLIESDNRMTSYEQQTNIVVLDKDKDIEEDIDIKENNIKEKRFVKPTLQEVIDYCEEKRNGVDPEKWFNYYESNGWKVGKNSMKNWKACVNTWARQNFGNNNNATSNETTDKGFKKYSEEEIVGLI